MNRKWTGPPTEVCLNPLNASNCNRTRNPWRSHKTLMQPSRLANSAANFVFLFKVLGVLLLYYYGI